jgi:AmmeMemoRadiSam system protein B
MERLMKFLEHQETAPAGNAAVIGGISPHDDYLYAGRVYFPLYRSLHAREVVIFGVTHAGVRKAIGDPRGVVILDDFQYWKGPFGNIPVSPLREFIEQRLGRERFLVSRKAHVLEHSIEALLPFVQYYNRDIRITPIMVTGMPLETMQGISDRLSDIFAEYISQQHLSPGKDIVFLISSDADHYGRDFNNIPFGEDDAAHGKGTGLDIRLAKTYLTGSMTVEKVQGLTGELWGKTYADSTNAVWCGRYSVPFGMLAMEKTVKRLLGKDLHGTLLRYSDSYSEGTLPLVKTGMGTTAPFSLKHWVGYIATSYTTD